MTIELDSKGNKIFAVFSTLLSVLVIPEAFAMNKQVQLFSIFYSESPFSEIEFVTIILIFTVIGIVWKIMRNRQR